MVSLILSPGGNTFIFLWIQTRFLHISLSIHNLKCYFDRFYISIFSWKNYYIYLYRIFSWWTLIQSLCHIIGISCNFEWIEKKWVKLIWVDQLSPFDTFLKLGGTFGNNTYSNLILWNFMMYSHVYHHSNYGVDSKKLTVHLCDIWNLLYYHCSIMIHISYQELETRISCILFES